MHGKSYKTYKENRKNTPYKEHDERVEDII